MNNAQEKLNANEIAANGPIPGDVSLYEKELSGCKTLDTPGYYSSLNGAELADAKRSAIFPFANFTGSMTEENEVFAYRSETDYPGASYINTRLPGELYLAGGDFPPLTGPCPAGPYLSKVDAASGKEIWRTHVDNANISKRWIGNVNLNIMPNGKIPLAWSNRIALIDGDTGEILKTQILPSGETNPEDVNYKHLTIAPDGTLICKDQTRPTGMKLQGTMAIIQGIMKGFKQTNSYMVALHPETLEILDEIQIPEPASVPHTITMLDGKIAIYVGVDSGVIRFFWDSENKKLSQDTSWTVKPMKPGQTTVAAASILGDWIVLQTNGAGSTAVASSIVAVHNKDASRMNVIFPFGDLPEGQWSFCPPKPQVDPENSLIYSADMGVRKVACININQETGELSLRYVLDDTTNTFQPLIGPKDNRIQILSNIEPLDPNSTTQQMVFSGQYKEQVTWREASTGRILAASDFFEPLTINSLIVPGFGGRFYFPTLQRFYILQVLPKS